jgi:hypothetical protein
MITDAEAQRQFDTNQCQDFTRCTVGKCKNKSAAFEYTDIDMESIISSEEYEKRYIQSQLLLCTAVRCLSCFMKVFEKYRQ